MVDATKYVISAIEEDVDSIYGVPFINPRVPFEYHNLSFLMNDIVKYVNSLYWDNSDGKETSLLPKLNLDNYHFCNGAYWHSWFDKNNILYVDFALIIDNYCLDVLPQEIQENWVYCPYPGFVPDKNIFSANRGVVQLDRLLFGNRGGA